MNAPSNDPNRVSTWIRQNGGADATPTLSIVVPAYNEERRLPPTLIDMIDFCEARYPSYEIVVVDDGSSDKTSSTVQKFSKVRPQVRLIRLPRNQGKGHAVRLGVLSSQGEMVLFADADGATPIAELDRLVAALTQGADVAIGSRAKHSKETKVDTVIHRKMLGRIFNWCVNFVLLPGVEDTQCGFKLFSRKAAAFLFTRQQSDRFSFDVELLFLARQAGLTTEEVPINWTNIPGSKVNLILDALAMFRDILRFRVRHRGVSRQQWIDYEKELSTT